MHGSLTRPVTDPHQRRMCVDALAIAVWHRRTIADPLLVTMTVNPRTLDTPAVIDWRDAAASRIGI